MRFIAPVESSAIQQSKRSIQNMEKIKTLAERQDLDAEIVVLAEFTDQKKIKEE